MQEKYLDPHEPGAKLDAGKTRPGLVFSDFSNALMAVAEVGTFGANKYSDHGWQLVENGQTRYTDALYRHLMAHQSGELKDTESTFLHLAHAAWNALAILEFEIKKSDTYINATTPAATNQPKPRSMFEPGEFP